MAVSRSGQHISSLAQNRETVFQDGTSELKIGMPLAGVSAELGLEPDAIDGLPRYRNPAYTGNAMGFVVWH